MRRLEQRGAVAFAVVIFIALVIAVWGLFKRTDDAPLARLLGQPKLRPFARTSYTSRQRKLAVSAIVRPCSIRS